MPLRTEPRRFQMGRRTTFSLGGSGMLVSLPGGLLLLLPCSCLASRRAGGGLSGLWLVLLFLAGLSNLLLGVALLRPTYRRFRDQGMDRLIAVHLTTFYVLACCTIPPVAWASVWAAGSSVGKLIVLYVQVPLVVIAMAIA